MKNRLPLPFVHKSLKLASAACCLSLALLANNAMAQNQYFVGPSGGIANGGSYSWDTGGVWGALSTSAGGSGTGWTQGTFARFYKGANDTFTVTVNADEQMIGLYNDIASATPGTVIINSAGAGDDLDVITAIQGFLVNTGDTVTINSPIVGAGGVAPELAGTLNLFSTTGNSYTGGTALGDSGNTLTYFNNNASFGTGGIQLGRTANFSTLGGVGGAPLTIANAMSINEAEVGSSTSWTGLNFPNAANTPVTYSGGITMGTVGLDLRSSGSAATTISGAISGTGTLYISANTANGPIILSAASPAFTGAVTVTGVGGTYGGGVAGTLQMAIANGLSAASAFSLQGGTLNAGGYGQANTGALGMTASSTLKFGATSGTALSFANSSAVAWTGVLNLADWQGNSVADGGTSSDTLQFGVDATGLTSAQLADIEFDGNAGTLGEAALDANGFVEIVPEPSTIALGVIGGMTMLARLRRRTA